MHPLNQAFLAELRKDHPSGIVQKPELLEAMVRFCHRNIQYFRALKESVEFRRQVHKMYGDYCTAADLVVVLARADMSVLSEEDYIFPVGHYPMTFFINNDEQMGVFIDGIMTAPAERKPKRQLGEARFFCVGSCFATNVAYYLSQIGARIHTSVLAESVNSPRNNVDLFHFFDTGERRGLLLNDEMMSAVQLDEIRTAFLDSDTLILTLGCAYSLTDAATDMPIKRVKDAASAKFDQPTVAGIVRQLRTIVDVCERKNFREIYMTVSPVPLSGTLTHGLNPFISDSASKAMLRAAVEELRADTCVQYIPSFEVFRQAAIHTFFPTFGLGDGCSRHVNPDITERVIRRFVDNNFVTEAGGAPATNA